jgi:hypothetical protein
MTEPKRAVFKDRLGGLYAVDVLPASPRPFWCGTGPEGSIQSPSTRSPGAMSRPPSFARAR